MRERVEDRLSRLDTSLAIINLVFIILYLTLAFHNRFATDDFHFLFLSENNSVLDAVQGEYNQWVTRYTATFWLFSFLEFKSVTGFLFLYQIVLLGLLVSAFYTFFRSAYPIVSRMSSLNHAVSASAILFVSTYAVGESWFWVAASSTYLLSGVAVIFLLAFLIRPTTILSGLGATLSAFYIGGSLGPLALVVLFLLSLRITIHYKNLKERIPDIIAFITCGVAFYLLYAAPGNTIRQSFFNEISLLDSFLLNFKLSGIVLLYKMTWVLFFIPAGAIVFANLLHSWLRQLNIPGKSRNLKILFVFFITGVGVFLYQWPITYMTQDIAADRALLFPCMMVLAGCTVIVHLLDLPASSDPIAKIIITAYLVVQIPFQYQLVGDYSHAYDKRKSQLENAKPNTSIKLSPLPDSGLLKSAEISSNPMHHANVHLARYYGLKTVQTGIRY